ncbi:peptidase [Sphingomonas paeninsulae]|jgi:putative proteasome-type protease|uniref:Peptidase n=1 Tax=Sphingomonas paeninsulae TaxID=2319844 RepID=A0A494TAN4_SPHPE|nr:peptidase [Sphingomonas paeninsulae]AYJ86110.1 peptidase [Sphingomonas paeninsulae]
MTYCVGLLVDAGLVIISDTRTNAGIDNISTYKKLHTLIDDEERTVFVASAGSLSVTQSMLSMLKEGLPCLDDTGVPRRVETQHTMFRVAQLVGEALSTARRAIGHTLEGTKINSSASILLGGRLGDGPLALYLVYAEGNFIECMPDAPFMQIGELKYGKPILDRALQWESPLDEAVKVALMSFDSTMRSNLSVGLPFDLVAISSDKDQKIVRLRIEADDSYFALLSSEWGRLLNESRAVIPDPPFLHLD